MFPPGFEPGTFRVLGERDNHYTTETDAEVIERAGGLQPARCAIRSYKYNSGHALMTAEAGFASQQQK